jgi:hypothetical protein
MLCVTDFEKDICNWKQNGDESSQNKVQMFLILFFVLRTRIVTIVSWTVKIKYHKNYCIQGCDTV